MNFLHYVIILIKEAKLQQKIWAFLEKLNGLLFSVSTIVDSFEGGLGHMSPMPSSLI